MAKLQIVAGATSQTVNIFIQDSSSTTGAGLTGLVFNSSGLVAYYALPKAAAVQITLATLAAITTAYSSGGFKEIDATNMPGWYRLDLPDAAIASGRFSSVHLKGATNMAPLPLEIELTAVNNQDAVRFGMTALPNANAAAASGLPVLGTNATAISFTAGMTISNAGGDALVLTSSGSNGNALNATANGTGSGIKLTPGATGNGLLVAGGATSGSAVKFTGTAGNAIALELAGQGSAVGFSVTGGATGAAAKFIGGATSGVAISLTTTSGDGLSIVPTAGHGIVATGNGTSKHGFFITGGTAGTSDGLSCVAGTGGVPIRGDITGNVTGNLSGSVGSVTGAVGSVTGAVGSVTARVTANTDQLAGQTVTAAAGVTFPTSVASPTNITAGTITTVTNLTNAPTAGDFTATMKTSLNAATPSVTVSDKTGFSLTAAQSPNLEEGTAQAGAASTITLRSGASATDNLFRGQIIEIYGATGGGQARVITAYVGSTKVATIDEAWITNPDATSTYRIIHRSPKIDSSQQVVAASVQGNVTGSVASVTGAVGSVTGAVGSVTGNVGGNVVGSVASVVARVTANTDQLAGQTVSAAAGVTFPSSVASPTNITAGTITTVTNLTNAPTAGDFTATMKTSLNAATPALSAAGVQAIWDALTSALTTAGSIGKLLVTDIDATISSRLASASYTAPPSAATIAGAVWDVTLASHLTAGSTGFALNAAGSAGDPWSTALPGAYGAGTAGFIVGTNIDALISSRTKPADTQAAVTTVTNLTNAPTSGDFTATMKTSLNAATPALSAAGVQAIWDALTSALTTVGSIGKLLVTDIDAAISSRSTFAGGAVASVTGNVGGNVVGSVGSVVANVNTNDSSGTTTLLTRIPGTVQPQTGDSFARLGAPAGASVSADIAQIETNVVAVPTSAQNADTLLGRNLAGGSNGGHTVQDALRPLRNKVDAKSVPGVMIIYEEDGTTEAWRGNLDTDVAAEPIVEISPTT